MMNELEKSEASYLSFNLGDERIAIVLRDEAASMISGVVQRINPQYIRLRAPLSTSDMNHYQMKAVGTVGAVIPWSEIKLFWVMKHDEPNDPIGQSEVVMTGAVADLGEPVSQMRGGANTLRPHGI